MTSRPPVAAGLTPSKPNSPTFSASNESVDHANRIALVNPVIEAFRQQRRLRPIRPCNEALHQIPPQNHQENLSSSRVFTHPGSRPAVAPGLFDRHAWSVAMQDSGPHHKGSDGRSVCADFVAKVV